MDQQDMRIDKQDARMEKLNNTILEFGKEIERVQKGGIKGVVSVPSALPTFKVPHFDGTTSWVAFRLQFEKVAKGNNWDDDQAVTALTLALRGDAVQILENVSGDCNTLACLLEALESRYGEKHLEHMFKVFLSISRVGR